MSPTPLSRQLHHLAGEHILVQILLHICLSSFILQNHNIILTSRDFIMSQDYEFKGWMGLDEKAIGNMKWQSFEPKPWEETDIDILITHCGFVTLARRLLRSSNSLLAFVHQTFTHSDLGGARRSILYVSATRSSVRPSKWARTYRLVFARSETVLV